MVLIHVLPFTFGIPRIVCCKIWESICLEPNRLDAFGNVLVSCGKSGEKVETLSIVVDPQLSNEMAIGDLPQSSVCETRALDRIWVAVLEDAIKQLGRQGQKRHVKKGGRDGLQVMAVVREERCQCSSSCMLAKWVVELIQITARDQGSNGPCTEASPHSSSAQYSHSSRTSFKSSSSCQKMGNYVTASPRT